MRISVATDSLDGVAELIVDELRRRGHTVVAHGAVAEPADTDWAVVSADAAREVAAGDADMAVVACWTGTGASIAANKVPGVRAALCADAATAAGARTWNDANVLALSLRLVSAPALVEILDAWFAAEPSAEAQDVANIAHLENLDHVPSTKKPSLRPMSWCPVSRRRRGRRPRIPRRYAPTFFTVQRPHIAAHRERKSTGASDLGSTESA